MDKQTRGIRNNNPGNIRKSMAAWRGKITGDDTEFEVFDTPENGIRALAMLLHNYQIKYGLNNIHGIINRWAPPAENKTGAYIATCCAALGVAQFAAVDLGDPVTLTLLVKSIIKQENGSQPYENSVISAGVKAALA